MDEGKNKNIMEKDYSTMLPAIFNDKDLVGYDWVEDFYNTFGSNFVCNRYCNTFVGFIVEDYEVQVHFFVNRLTVQFLWCKPSQNVIDDIIEFFSLDDEHFCSSVWQDSDMINFQYYCKPEQ